MMPELEFPPGTPVRVRQVTYRRDREVVAETVGVVEEWDERPTGSWYAHGKNDKLWLRRLKLRKVDGELVLLVVDKGTHIARLSAASAGA